MARRAFESVARGLQSFGPVLDGMNTAYLYVKDELDEADDAGTEAAPSDGAANVSRDPTTVVEDDPSVCRRPDPMLSDQAALPEFRLQHLLGTGASSRVYVARDYDDVEVVVKILDATYAGQNPRASDYERALEHICEIDHPNVVSIDAWGRTQDNRIYTVMPCDPAARDLRAWIRPGSCLPPDDVAEISRQVLDGIYRLHRSGLVHRDIKPSNCLMHPDPIAPRIELIDFSATLYAGRARLVRLEDREVIGTPTYMAPEREDRVTGFTSDLYSAGVVIYELLVGEPPYRAKTKNSLMRMHRLLPVPRATERMPGLPSSVDAFFARAMAKHPQHRFDDAREMAEAFVRSLAA